MRDQLRTDQLELRLPLPSDADELHEIFSDPTTHTIGGGPFVAREQTTRWIERRQAAYQHHGLAWYLVRSREDGGLLGNCGLLVGRACETEPEIGYMIRFSHQRRGYAGEAGRAVVAEAASAGFRTLWSTIRPANTASCRVIERLGFRVQFETDDDGPMRYYVRRLDEPGGVRAGLT